MNRRRSGIFGLALVAWLAALIPLTARAGGREPVITGIRPSGTNLLVTVQLPDGCRHITLESRPRMGTGAWIPRKDHWPAEGVGELGQRCLQLGAFRGAGGVALDRFVDRYGNTSDSIHGTRLPHARLPEQRFFALTR